MLIRAIQTISMARLELFAPKLVEFIGAITSFVPIDSSTFPAGESSESLRLPVLGAGILAEEIVEI